MSQKRECIRVLLHIFQLTQCGCGLQEMHVGIRYLPVSGSAADSAELKEHDKMINTRD